jgi:hypothetical protein
VFDILNKLDDEYSNFTFGSNKEGNLFINGQKIDYNLNNKNYQEVEKFLLKNKLISVVKEEA